VIEIDAASTPASPNIRELIERSRFAPVQARWKGSYVIGRECHIALDRAFNGPCFQNIGEPPSGRCRADANHGSAARPAAISPVASASIFRRIPLAALEGHLSATSRAASRFGITRRPLQVVRQRAPGRGHEGCGRACSTSSGLWPAPIESRAIWELLGAGRRQELLNLGMALAAFEPLELIEACRLLLTAAANLPRCFQGLPPCLRDLGVGRSRPGSARTEAAFPPSTGPSLLEPGPSGSGS